MIERRLDCLGDACPVPLIKTKNKLESMKIGEILIVEIDHSCAMKNVPEWAKKTGYIVETKEIDDGQWEILIEKTK